MSLFAYLIVNGAYNEYIGVKFDNISFSVFKTR